MGTPQIVIATTKSWNVAKAKRFQKKYANQIRVETVEKRDALNVSYLERLDPDWIFFPHWSWIIPEEIISGWRCVIFHTSPLPWGRGGSPIQNQIARRVYDSEVCAVEATGELDAGPVYARRYIDLSKGTVEEILMQASELTFEMIGSIALNPSEPVEQEGAPIVFKRRKPNQSRLPGQATSVRSVYDFIRMLDGEGYPPAFIEYGNQLLQLRNARIQPDGSITGSFQLRIIQEDAEQ